MSLPFNTGTNLGQVRRVHGATNQIATFLIWSKVKPKCLFVVFDLLISSKFDFSKRSNVRSDVRRDVRIFFRRS